MNGRIYDPVLARFLSPDPFVQAPNFTQSYNRYTYCFNNPFKYVDPDGEIAWLIPAAIFIAKAAITGAAISAAAYTVGVAVSPGGFNNWDWGQLGKSAGWGAVSGVATAGIGAGFKAAGTFAGTVGTEVLRGAAHGVAQGGISALQGGNFAQNFAIGAVSSWAGHGLEAGLNKLGASPTASLIAGVGFSTISGGVTAEITGGNFWQGAATGLTVGLLNQAGAAAKRWAYSRKEGVIVAGVVLEGPNGVGGIFGEGSYDPANRQSAVMTRYELELAASGLQTAENVADALAVATKSPKVYAVARTAGLGADGIRVGLDLYDGNYQNARIRGGAAIFTRFIMRPQYSNTTNIVIDKVSDHTVNHLTR